ncbi:hypothetical protein [Ligilactobacillus animalis]|uniref:hypothetical protein n=1 Tax=Ligilactobacillus animalis TaxID=1605 RepID=UPI002902A0B6|nr:hypothetical protein [Ligilactobacillus animalis]MDU1488394.1 hypothetical protein [Ligilactobacillus animalis]
MKTAKPKAVVSGTFTGRELSNLEGVGGAMKYAESLSNATSTASAISKLTDTLSDLTAVGNEYIRLEPA